MSRIEPITDIPVIDVPKAILEDAELQQAIKFMLGNIYTVLGLPENVLWAGGSNRDTVRLVTIGKKDEEP